MQITISTNIGDVLERFTRRRESLPHKMAGAVEQGSRILAREVERRLPRRTGRLRASLFRQVTRSGDDVAARVGVTHPAAKALEGGAYIRANASGALAIPILRGLPQAREVQASPLRYGYRRTFILGRAVMGVPVFGGRLEVLYALVPAVRIKAVRYMKRARGASLRQMKQLLKLTAVRTLKGESDG